MTSLIASKKKDLKPKTRKIHFKNYSADFICEVIETQARENLSNYKIAKKFKICCKTLSNWQLNLLGYKLNKKKKAPLGLSPDFTHKVIETEAKDNLSNHKTIKNLKISTKTLSNCQLNPLGNKLNKKKKSPFNPSPDFICEVIKTQIEENLSNRKTAEKFKISRKMLSKLQLNLLGHKLNKKIPKKRRHLYSVPFIRKVLKIQAEENLSNKKIAERFNISSTSVSRWKNRASLCHSVNFRNVAPESDLSCHSLVGVDERSALSVLDDTPNLGSRTVNIPCTAENFPFTTPEPELSDYSLAGIDEESALPVLDDTSNPCGPTDDGVEKLFQAILAESEAAWSAGLQELDLSGSLLSSFDEASEKHLHSNGSKSLQGDGQLYPVNAARTLNAAMASSTVGPKERGEVDLEPMAGTQQPDVGQSWLDLFRIGLDLDYH